MFGFLFSRLLDILTNSFFDWAKGELKNKLDSQIDIPTQQNQVKQLLTASIKYAMKNSNIKYLKKKEIIKSIKDNMKIIFEWIVISNNLDISFSDYSERIFYDTDEKSFRTFYNSLFYQIKENKNNYENLQNLMILDKLDVMDNTINATHELVKSNYVMLSGFTKNTIYTGELKQVEEKLKLRQFNLVRTMLDNLEQKILGNNKPEEIEKYYQLLTDSFFLDSSNQSKAIEPLTKLIKFTQDEKKNNIRKIYKNLLENNFDIVQKQLDKIFENENTTEIEQYYYDIQINVYIMQRDFDASITFINKYKENMKNHLHWLCRLYFFQSKLDDAMDLINANKYYFNNDDYNIKLIKIKVTSAYYLEKTIQRKSFQNITILQNIMPDSREIITLCGDDNFEVSYLHSVIALIYSVLDEPENAKIEYEKSLELNPKNMNTLKNYPFILINSNRKEDREKSLEYTKQYLSEYPDDHSIESLYYNILVFLSPKQAIIELEQYTGTNEEIKPMLLYAYDLLYEYNKATEMVNTILSSKIMTSVAYFFIGLHYELIKNYSDSFDYYCLALENGKNFNETDRTVDKILKLSVLTKDKKLMKKGISIIENYYSIEEIIINYIEPFLYSLLMLHDFSNCYRYCQEAIKNDIKSKFIYETLFSCYYNTYNYFSALDILNEYTEEFGSFPQKYLQAISICYLKTQRLEEAYNFMKYISEPVSILEYQNQAQFLYAIKKYDEAIQVAYYAYLAYPKNQEAMELFISLGMFQRNDHELTDEQIPKLKNCISEYISSNFEKPILTSNKIDTNAPPEEIIKELADIIPNNINIEDRLEIIYKKKLPVSFYKNVVNRHILLIYDSLFHQKKYKIHCYNDMKNRNILNSTPPIYIDIGTLILLDTLNLLDFLPEIFSEIFVIQYIYDELVNFEDIIPKSNKGGFLSKDMDGNVSYQHDNTPYEKINDKVRRILQFITNHQNIKIVGQPLEIVNKLPEKLIELILKSKNNIELEIIKCGYLKNTPIFIENPLFRELYNALENSHKSISIIDLLHHLQSTNKISIDKYCNSLSLMSKLNYFSVPFNYKIILHLIKQNGFIIDTNITHIFDSLCSDEYDKTSVFICLMRLIHIIWNEYIGMEIKYNWSDYLIDKVLFLTQTKFNDLLPSFNRMLQSVYNIKMQKDFIKYLNEYNR